MRYLCVLCEGKTELLFCNEVLSPYLWNKGVIVLPSCLITNRKLNKRGGITSYNQVMTDLRLLIKQHSDTPDNHYWFTTMFDLYALPVEFPIFHEVIEKVPYDKVEILEEAFAKDVVAKCSIDESRFIPYIQLHEFEALVLCNIEYLMASYPNSRKELEALSCTIKQDYEGNTELVDNGVETAPSKRIINALSGKYRYDKPQSGKEATKDIGIETLMGMCPHFSKWIGCLEQKLNVNV